MQKKVGDDLKSAMKARNRVEIDALRLLLADLRKAELDAGKPLDEGAEIAVLRKAAGRRKESIEQFQAAGRMDLVDPEKAGLAVIEKYLPKLLDEDATRKIIEQAVSETGAASKKEFGKVMGWIMSKHKGMVDPETVKRLVTEKLP